MSNLPQHIQGIIWVLLYCFIGVVGDAAVRVALGGDLSMYQVIFLRSLIPVLFMVPWLCKKEGVASLRPERPWYYFAMACVLLLSVAAFLKALSLLPLPQVAALSFVATLLTVFFAIVVFKEQFRWYRIIALLVGFGGALVIIRPGFVTFNVGVLYSLAASMCWVVFILMNKNISHHQSPSKVMLYPLLFVVPIMLPFALWHWQWPTTMEWVFIATHGICIGVNFWLRTKAFALADLGLIMPVEFSYLIFASIVGYIAFAEVLDVWTFTGALIIVLSAWYIVMHENKRHTSEEGEIATH